MSAVSSTSEAEILRRAIEPQSIGLSIESLSRVDFCSDDKVIMCELAAKARAGTLTEEERAALHQYEVVNDLLGILHSKARISLQKAGPNGA